jgi:hypothetical protein
MDIWVTWCRRQSKCAHCPEPITAGTPVVVGKLWAIKGERLKYPKVFRWHFPECWVEQARTHLDDTPFVPKRSTGRPPMELEPEVRACRSRLVRHYAVVVHQIRKAAVAGNINKVLTLEVRRQKIIVAVAAIGPVPKRWTIG